MLLGIQIGPLPVFLGGLALFALLLFQYLEGRRIIKFKGPLHMKVHRGAALALVAVALIHATFATLFLYT